MTSHRDILSAIALLKSGEDELSSERYVELLEALEQAVQALVLAPRGTDPTATGLWYNHERAPALARLAEALTPSQHDRRSQVTTDQGPSDREVLTELHEALLANSRQRPITSGFRPANRRL
jgi:hypothetical protein